MPGFERGGRDPSPDTKIFENIRIGPPTPPSDSPTPRGNVSVGNRGTRGPPQRLERAPNARRKPEEDGPAHPGASDWLPATLGTLGPVASPPPARHLVPRGSWRKRSCSPGRRLAFSRDFSRPSVSASALDPESIRWRPRRPPVTRPGHSEAAPLSRRRSME